VKKIARILILSEKAAITLKSEQGEEAVNLGEDSDVRIQSPNHAIHQMNW